MSAQNTLRILAFATGAFLGGLVTGLLISPKTGRENRKWISDHSDELTDWADKKGREFREKTDEKVNHIKTNVRKSVKDSVPDLYEATENLGLKDEDLETSGR
jgi:gas vesicle protein